ncbi:serine/threonine protein kinase, AGC [Mucor velutinosus]|uniref:ADP-ribosylation factor-like protein 6-interacting protein 4 n=1 Tax=Mucor velutinosus TaxID=708070 RepID=A0AAN7D3S0_9FUNG|nr:serine/threonine protein kinase, AGC [Mucor velutinosus]
MSKSASKHSKKQGKPQDVLEQLRKLAKKHKKSKDKSSKKPSAKAADHAMIPMTKDEYEKKRSIITTEYDAQTGRMRRKRATGEILESIVTKEQHLKINQMSTFMDGLSYQRQVIKK